jgi:NADH dehydrogenase [ubiquinone] 1 alpha subcomplex assembly factor 7
VTRDTGETPLARELRAIIAAEGPMPVSRFMALCLAHPRNGYYMARDPLGRAGDFTTAPEISQMFGELLGLWAAAVWEAMGAPSPVHLVELGPGRGTLMADALRAAQRAPAFHAAISVHLLEISPVLRERQRETLGETGRPISWHGDIDEVPDGPLIVLANEFFDALPVNQAVRTADGWHERVVGLNPTGEFVFGLSPGPIPRFDALLPSRLRASLEGSLWEWRDDRVASDLSRRIEIFGGAALVIDYGHAQSAPGDTLQAVRRHGYADPLASPGESDLTAHVDFEALGAVAQRHGLRMSGPLSQGNFLRRLGIEARAARLKAAATAEQGEAVDAALHRLTGDGPHAMGELFKVAGFAHSALPPLPGFDI